MPVNLSTPETEKATEVAFEYEPNFCWLLRCLVPPGEPLAGQTVTRGHLH